MQQLGIIVNTADDLVAGKWVAARQMLAKFGGANLPVRRLSALWSAVVPAAAIALNPKA